MLPHLPIISKLFRHVTTFPVLEGALVTPTDEAKVVNLLVFCTAHDYGHEDDSKQKKMSEK